MSLHFRIVIFILKIAFIKSALLNNCNSNIYPYGTDIVVCTNKCNECNVFCDSKDQCKGARVFSGALITNIYCTNENSCETSRFYIGNSDAYNYPNPYEIENFTSVYESVNIDCTGRTGCKNAQIYITGNYINGTHVDVNGPKENFEDSIFKCNLLEQQSCQLTCGGNRNGACNNAKFECLGGECSCNGNGCGKLFTGGVIVNTKPPSQKPTKIPTLSPTLSTTIPSLSPSMTPTVNPSYAPSFTPTKTPSKTPTTGTPTINPSKAPTDVPSVTPTITPSLSPTTSNPTLNPSQTPTLLPSDFPTKNPTNVPTNIPSNSPSTTPTLNPTGIPTQNPSNIPTNNPTYNPSKNPSRLPSYTPTNIPTGTPTANPSQSPIKNPTNAPTMYPSKQPSVSPINAPTKTPSHTPTFTPTNNPSQTPTLNPTESPVKEPTFNPTKTPSKNPTITPTNNPTQIPTNTPTLKTEVPSKNPTEMTVPPSNNPSHNPSNYPTNLPSNAPAKTPTFSPSILTIKPTNTPSISPTIAPTIIPNNQLLPQELNSMNSLNMILIIIAAGLGYCCLMTLTIMGIIFRRTIFCLNKREQGIAHETGLTQIVNISPTMSDFSAVIDGLQKTGFPDTHNHQDYVRKQTHSLSNSSNVFRMQPHSNTKSTRGLLSPKVIDGGKVTRKSPANSDGDIILKFQNDDNPSNNGELEYTESESSITVKSRENSTTKGNKIKHDMV